MGADGGLRQGKKTQKELWNEGGRNNHMFQLLLFGWNSLVVIHWVVPLRRMLARHHQDYEIFLGAGIPT